MRPTVVNHNFFDLNLFILVFGLYADYDHVTPTGKITYYRSLSLQNYQMEGDKDGVVFSMHPFYLSLKKLLHHKCATW